MYPLKAFVTLSINELSKIVKFFLCFFFWFVQEYAFTGITVVVMAEMIKSQLPDDRCLFIYYLKTATYMIE